MRLRFVATAATLRTGTVPPYQIEIARLLVLRRFNSAGRRYEGKTFSRVRCHLATLTRVKVQRWDWDWDWERVPNGELRDGNNFSPFNSQCCRP